MDQVRSAYTLLVQYNAKNLSWRLRLPDIILHNFALL